MKIWLKVAPDDVAEVRKRGGMWDKSIQRWFFFTRDFSNIQPILQWIDKDLPSNSKKFEQAKRAQRFKNHT